ncbi:MAG: hypothetical protein KGI49_03790 [Patescibacteria group bacterium]|nr:hypothetical protein [Patescibacteria group bacterium]
MKRKIVGWLLVLSLLIEVLPYFGISVLMLLPKSFSSFPEIVYIFFIIQIVVFIYYIYLVYTSNPRHHPVNTDDLSSENNASKNKSDLAFKLSLIALPLIITPLFTFSLLMGIAAIVLAIYQIIKDRKVDTSNAKPIAAIILGLIEIYLSLVMAKAWSS